MKSVIVTLALMFSYSTAAFSEEKAAQPAPSITLEGTGQTTVTPDIATADLGVITEAVNAKDALAQNNKQMTEVMKALHHHGIADRDVQTVTLKIDPKYQDDKEGKREQKLLGYVVSNVVRVRVRNLPRLGELLVTVVGAGATYVQSITFSLAEPEATLAKARLLALRNATSKADEYAAAAGAKLGQAVRITERSSALSDVTFPMFGDFAAAQAPIATGEQIATANVEVTFNLIYAAAKP